MENYSHMKFANFCYTFVLRARKSTLLYFPRVIQKYTKISKLHMTVFSTFYDIFSTKLHNFTKFRMLFPAVLMNLPNSQNFV